MLAGKDAVQASRDWIQGAKTILGTDLNYLFRGEPEFASRNDYDAGGVDNPLYDYFNWGAGDGILKLRPGTKKYAKAVCARIDRFIEANGGRDVLKARRLQK
jgi:hypothetical protein